MYTSFVVGGIVAVWLALGGTAPAQSSCDAGVTKAVAKKVSCKLKVFAAAQKSGATADGARLTRCEEKFAAACAKAKSRNDCQAQTSSCAAIEAAADAAVDGLVGTPTTSTTTTTLDPLRPCGRDPNGTCGGICDLYPAEGCVEDASGNCVCFLPCQPLGGIGQCHGECADPRASCSFTGDPSFPCACTP
jgi:hypothetical protein